MYKALIVRLWRLALRCLQRTHPLLEIKKAIQTPMLIQNSVYPDKKSEVKVLELHNDVRITANKLLVWQKVKYVHIAVNS